MQTAFQAQLFIYLFVYAVFLFLPHRILHIAKLALQMIWLFPNGLRDLPQLFFRKIFQMLQLVEKYGCTLFQLNSLKLRNIDHNNTQNHGMFSITQTGFV